jgi:uncharacterized protein YjiS (DUF1127 family)
VVGVAAGVRLVGTTLNLVTAPVYSEFEADESVIADIGVERPERLAETGARLQTAEKNRVGADRGWIASLLVVLFAIHISRMGLDKSALGILSPLVAVLGDVVVALCLTYVVIVPVRLFVRRLTRGAERLGWARLLDAPARTGIGAWPQRALRAGLDYSDWCIRFGEADRHASAGAQDDFVAGAREHDRNERRRKSSHGYGIHGSPSFLLTLKMEVQNRWRNRRRSRHAQQMSAECNFII